MRVVLCMGQHGHFHGARGGVCVCERERERESVCVTERVVLHSR